MIRTEEARPEPKIKKKPNEEIPFNDWSQDKIDEGKKRCTSRTHKYPDDPRVDKILPLKWGFIKEYLYELEGADSPEELQKVINQIFRKEVSEDRMFWVHFGDFQEEDENNRKLDEYIPSSVNSGGMDE